MNAYSSSNVEKVNGYVSIDILTFHVAILTYLNQRYIDKQASQVCIWNYFDEPSELYEG